MRALSADVLITKVADAAGAAQTDVTATGVDCSGCQGVIFLTSYGTAASDNIMHAEQSANNSSYADLTGTAVGASTSDEDQWLDIYHPTDRYVRVVAARGTSSTLENIWAIRYGLRKAPADNTTAGTIHGELHVGEAEGTA